MAAIWTKAASTPTRPNAPSGPPLRLDRDRGRSCLVDSDQELYQRLDFDVTCVSALWNEEPEPQS
jgi:hypothetical protein